MHSLIASHQNQSRSKREIQQLDKQLSTNAKIYSNNIQHAWKGNK
jgi:hypothetical protein